MAQRRYKSVEMKILDFLEPAIETVGNFSKDVVQSFYGAVATPYRLLTVMRKFAYHQTFVDRKRKEVDSLSIGNKVGLVAGLGADAANCFIIASEASKGNYLPLGVIIGANVLSVAYELGITYRLNK